MTRATIAGATLAVAVVLLAVVAVGPRVLERGADEPGGTERAATGVDATAVHPAAGTQHDFLFGRISTIDGAVYEGRLRFGGDEEAFWGNTFNGTQVENRWVAQVPPDRSSGDRRSVKVFGFEIPRRGREAAGRRPFMARFGDIARIEVRGDDVRVTLKSGTVFDLDRFEASDFDDGVRVWDGERGAVDLDSLRIRAIRFLPTPELDVAAYRLYGTVRARDGEFTGFVQWNRLACVGSDELVGHADAGPVRLPFDTLRSVERRPAGGALATLLDGREIELAGTGELGDGNRGLYVDDRRYGRVLVSWDAFERVEFGPGGSGPAYDDFPPGEPLRGRVTTRAGSTLAGRLVFDLDESETVETLDAPSGGIDYSIPFGRIASIVPPGGHTTASVILVDGPTLRLERAGDLGDGNAGMLVFAGDGERPAYVPWAEVARVDLDRPRSPAAPSDRR